MVIGLDGATWDLLGPLCERDLMPNLRALRDQSLWGVLNATYPPVTAPSWTTFATGVNPGRHGVFDFFTLEPGKYGKRLIDLAQPAAPPIWQRVKAAGGTPVVINFPALYPATPDCGVSVAGMLAPNTDSRFFSPRHLFTALRPRVGEYQIDVRWPGGGAEALPRYCRAIAALTRARTRWAEAILTAGAWDLAIVVYVTLDRLGHKAWGVLQQLARGDDKPETELTVAVGEALTELDRGIGQLLAMAGPDTDIYLASDHGFGPGGEVFEPNVLLAERGLLALHGGRTALVRMAKRLRDGLIAPAGRVARKGWGVAPTTTGRAFAHLVDWSRTRAFALSVTDMGIYVNQQGRFPQGMVRGEADRRAVVEEVMACLAELRHPLSGRRLAVETRRREEIFHGQWTEAAPDLLFVVEGGALHSGTRTHGARVHAADFLRGDGNHRQEGIFACRAVGIGSGRTRHPWAIEDIAPTILQRMGIPGAAEMDGVDRLGDRCSERHR